MVNWLLFHAFSSSSAFEIVLHDQERGREGGRGKPYMLRENLARP